jgi:ArsR family transcriptional regulator, arsenate/arsenite/antimonite-responsive transcriptional repressor
METIVKKADFEHLPTRQALAALAALSQETRLGIYRLLVEIGPQGLHVGAIAERLALANATLSFHLKELANADLIVAAPNGRSIIYSANFSTMNALIGYLTENCCAGATCATTLDCKPVAKKAESTKRKSA